MGWRRGKIQEGKSKLERAFQGGKQDAKRLGCCGLRAETSHFCPCNGNIVIQCTMQFTINQPLCHIVTFLQSYTYPSVGSA